ncbi:O-antigen ligase family protein [Rhizobium hidalgonense]|uniref:O-antigen ligase family protein n=1 Tax=Rhizobium hidalgonense TaxID=1538159 RepID=UPI00287268C6|nr:O-antigen ligase family protein [Rhizobium hidalgonense]MDR9808756.1 O-antigen ligase family protein [Rhizobium hidalgonense]
MQRIEQRAATVFSLSATVLVLFNYLFFLKWYQYSGSRLWVAAVIIASAPFAVVAFRGYRQSLLPTAILIAYCSYTSIGYFASRGPEFNILYLSQFLLTTAPFFAAGVLAGERPAGLTGVAVFAAAALLIALPIAWMNYGSLWEGDDFRNILGIPQIPGRTPYYSYYQLVAYGIAIGSIPVFVWLLTKFRSPTAEIAGLAVTLLLAEVGSRTVFLILPVVFAALVFRTKGIVHAAIFLTLSAVLVAGVFFTPAGKSLAVVQRMEGEAERYEQGAIFKPKTGENNPYDASGAFDTGDGGDHRTWSRRTLFEFALEGWIESPATFAFGHGLGSFSLDLTGIYPGWIPAPHDGEIYPHNWILEAGYEGGVIAVALLGVVFTIPFWRILRERQPPAGGLSITGMYLLVFGAAFLSGGIVLNYTLFFFCGAALSAQKRCEIKPA